MGKVSISLPNDLLREVEAHRARSSESRSDFFRRAAEALLRGEREREAIDRYVRGYLGNPEAQEEAAWAAHGQTRLAQVPWE
jgi:metal-responsive CopG/Arc/MetJ family transcriptional regulator